MGMMSWDDVVVIEQSKRSGDPTVVTVNCPDKAGLGCDLLRIVLEFGLYVTRGDFSTDGRWCYVVLWVVPRPSSLQLPNCSKPPALYLLTVFSLDRKGLIHDVTKVLCELELAIQRVKVTTTPDEKVLDMFFITDGMARVPCSARTIHHRSCISEAIAEELFGNELFAKEDCLSGDVLKAKKASITVDNLLSPTHTLLQIHCLDQKGLVYDILKISKDCDIRIVHGRISASVKGYRSLDLLIQKEDGKKIIDKDSQVALCSRLKEEILHPLRVIITNRGPDTELLVANPVELSGKGRPRVFFDVTLALKALGICVFSAEIGRHSTSDRQWEVYRFLLDESRGFPLTNNRAKRDIVDKVKRTLMGC
ncbi:ACT domain-containing protein ACR9-like protein [Tanacetum coccineum]|uniref:ACT domain-containing protein ACR n=1 Tax=Tanacetum coccineum TaxID=301880 RepID=A0ABQ5HQD6_9ASTR